MSIVICETVVCHTQISCLAGREIENAVKSCHLLQYATRGYTYHRCQTLTGHLNAHMTGIGKKSPNTEGTIGGPVDGRISKFTTRRCLEEVYSNTFPHACLRFQKTQIF